MKKEFDFDDIGKKTPYRVPEGFFDEMQRNVRKHTYGGKPAGHRLWITHGLKNCRMRSWKSSSASPKAIYF